MNTVAVTGAAGGIGRTVCRVLTTAGLRVRGLVRPEDDVSTVPLPSVELKVGYVQDPAAVADLLRGADAVVNCAALLPNALHLPSSAFREVNVGGALNVLGQAARAGVGRAVFFSTISVVDHVGRKITPATLFDYIPNPDDAYLASKIEGEKALRERAGAFAGPLDVLRPAFIYGPGNYAVWRTGFDLLTAGKMKLIGGGRARLPLIYAEDMARFILRRLTRPAAPAGCAVHVVSNPEPTTMGDVFDHLARRLGVAAPVSVAYPVARAAAEVVAWLPRRLRVGRLAVLTRARVAQYSRGYDLDGTVSREFLEAAAPLTGYRDGLDRMIDDYLRARPERRAA